uniref:Uncharacterized protein n=1 Tax=Amphimedon queenslandica TaxID=400682 RepID=A0A1X7US48_AMPQE
MYLNSGEKTKRAFLTYQTLQESYSVCLPNLYILRDLFCCRRHSNKKEDIS